MQERIPQITAVDRTIAASSPSLDVRNLSFSYGAAEVLRDLTFSIAPGRFTALLGPNGAGKTTPFLLIARLLEPKPETIYVEGRDIVRGGADALASLGIVFQQPTLDLDLSVRENLTYFAALHGIDRKSALASAERMLATLGMADRLDLRLRQLSGGQRRRIEIARGLLHSPRLLLLDEPTVGLDIPTRRAIVGYAHAVARENRVAVLWATHLIDEVAAEDDVIVLHQGRIAARATADEIIRQTAATSLAGAYEKLTGMGPRT